MGKLEFKRASKKTARARVALVGPAGSGKTFTALAIGVHLGKRVAVIDTEHGSASKYALPEGLTRDQRPDLFPFDALELDDFAPARYVEALEAAEEQGYDVVIIDSLSHAWMGKGGALDQVDKAAARSKSGNSYTAWRDVTPQHNALVEAMLSCKAHLIVTMRAKTEYVLEENDRGKKVPKKVGMAPVQRDGLEYEFDVTADLTLDNDLIVGKTRCSALKDRHFNKAGENVATILRDWLSDGAVAALSPVEEFLGRLRLCGGSAEANAILHEIGKRKAEFSEPELTRIRRVARETLDRFKGEAPPESGPTNEAPESSEAAS